MWLQRPFIISNAPWKTLNQYTDASPFCPVKSCFSGPWAWKNNPRFDRWMSKSPGDSPGRSSELRLESQVTCRCVNVNLSYLKLNKIRFFSHISHVSSLQKPDVASRYRIWQLRYRTLALWPKVLLDKQGWNLESRPSYGLELAPLVELTPVTWLKRLPPLSSKLCGHPQLLERA